MLLQQPQHHTIGPHCARRAQGTRENMACAFVTGLHRVTLQWLYSIASKAPPSPPTTYCFSTYPAVNANYRNPPLCRACAPYISSVFAGVYNLDLCLSACCTQPLPGCLLHHHSNLFEPGTQLSLSRADERPISLTCSRRSRRFSSPCQTVNKLFTIMSDAFPPAPVQHER